MNEKAWIEAIGQLLELRGIITKDEKDKWVVNKGKYLIHIAKDSKNSIKTFEVNI